MATIAINTSELPVPGKLAKGQVIITNSTANPNVPGNTAVLASFSTLQTDLATKQAEMEDFRTKLKAATESRDAALFAWNGGINAVAAFTESVTGGDAFKIMSAGFDVKAAPVPPQPVGQVENVKVSFTGTPGYSAVRWKRETNAEAYMVECSPEPITDTSWKQKGTVTEPKYDGNGATPGQKCWYRVAGVNRLGQGPWSEPALRPVM
jgi:hypothetical protein